MLEQVVIPSAWPERSEREARDLLFAASLAPGWPHSDFDPGHGNGQPGTISNGRLLKMSAMPLPEATTPISLTRPVLKAYTP